MSLSWKKLNRALQWRQQHGNVVLLIIGNNYVMIMSSVFPYIIIFIDINTPLCVCVDGDAWIKNGRHLWGGESMSGFARSLSFSRTRWVTTNIKQETHTHTQVVKDPPLYECVPLNESDPLIVHPLKSTDSVEYYFRFGGHTRQQPKLRPSLGRLEGLARRDRAGHQAPVPTVCCP